MKTHYSIIINEDITRGTKLGTMHNLNRRLFENLLEEADIIKYIKIFRQSNDTFISYDFAQPWTDFLQLSRDISEVDVLICPTNDHKTLQLIANRNLIKGSSIFCWFSMGFLITTTLPLFLQLRNIKSPTCYQCHLCSFKSSYPNIVKAHNVLAKHQSTYSHLTTKTIKSQTNVFNKCHRCLFCGKLYSRKYGLKIHIRTHTGYKPLQCKVCHRPFGDPSNLNKHTRLHTNSSSNNNNQSVYLCSVCGKSFICKRELEKHLKIKHANFYEVNNNDLNDMSHNNHQINYFF